MAEIAALGLKVENQQVDRAVDSLDKLSKSADRAEKSATGMGRGADRAGKQAARANEQAAQSTDKLARSYGGLNTAALTAARTMLGVAGAVIGIGAASRTLANFEQSMATVAAVTRASSDELTQMRDIAKELGATTEFTASQAADGLKFLGMAGFTAAESIAAVPAVLDLATAAAMGLAEAADIASNIMSGFGIAANEAASVADVLAAASTRSNTTVGQLGGAMSTVAPIASALNISLADTAAAIGVMSDAGIQGERAGTALRGVLASLAGPTTKAQKTLAGIGLTIKDVDPATNELSVVFDRLRKAGLSTSDAMAIFGREAASGALILVGASDRVGEFGKELSDVGGEASKLAAVMRDQLQGDLNSVASAIEGVIIAIGEAGLIRVIRAALQFTAEFVRSLSRFIDMIGQLTGAIADKLQPVFDRLSPALTFVAQNAEIAVIAISGFYSGRVLGGILLLTRAIGVGLVGSLKAAALAMRALVLANPIGVIVGAITAAGYAIYKFREDIAQVLGFDLIDIAKSAANYLIGSFFAAFEDIKFVWKNLPDIIGAAAVGSVNNSIRAINFLIKMATSQIDALIKAVNKIPYVDIPMIGDSLEIQLLENKFFDRLESTVKERNEAIAAAMSRDYIGSMDIAIPTMGPPSVSDIKPPSFGGGGGGGGLGGAGTREINQNAQAIRDLQQALHLAALSGKELAVEQARLSLNKYATADQIRQVEDLAAAIFDVQEEMKRRQQFGEGRDADKFILGETRPLSGGLFDDQYARYEAEAELERERYENQLERLIEARELQIETNRTYDELEAEAAQMHADRMAQIERAKQSVLLTSAGDMFAGIASIMKKSHGEQSGIYRAMFAASKAFAVANATINAYDAISKAWNSAPFPQNLIAVAATAPQVLAVVNSIRGTSLTGMAHDGIDSVPKTGTWLLEQGERVTTAQTSARMDSVLERIDAGMRQSRSNSAPGIAPSQPIINLIENPDRGGEAESRRNDDGEEELNIFVADIRGGGRRSQALELTYGLQRVGT